MRYILAFDLGTSGTKASLYNENGQSVASAFCSCETAFSPEGFHEQRPDDWWEMVVSTTRTILQQSGVAPMDVYCMAVSGHSLGLAPVDENGKLLMEYCPIWTDARATRQAGKFFEAVDYTQWYLTTGNGFPAHLYAIFKIMWVRDERPQVYRQTACFLGTKDYVNLRLTGVMATDHSYASGSGVYDLRNWTYHPEYLRASGVNPAMLPKPRASSEPLGTLTEAASRALGLPRQVLVMAGGVDNACMALGAGSTREGDAYTSLGSSAWIAVSSHEPIVNAQKKPYVFAHCVPGLFTSATSIFSAGSTFRWLKNTLFPEMGKRAAEEGRDVYELLTELAQQSPAGSNRLICTPAFAGGSGLDRNSGVRGSFTGLTLSHTAADIVRATMEGICLNLRMALDVLSECTLVADDMLLVGGGGKSRFWRSLFASVYEKNILQTNVGQDAGSLGAAAVAAVGAGLWESFDRVKSVHVLQDVVKPDPDDRLIYQKLLGAFRTVADAQSDFADLLAGW